MEPKLVKPIVQRRLLVARALRAASAGVAAVILLLLSSWHGVDSLKLGSPSEQVWVRAGQGNLAVFVRNEPEPWDLTGDRDLNPDADNSTIKYFWPRVVGVDRLGLEYVTGTYYMTPFRGWAVSVAYWHGVAFALLVFLVSHLLARRAGVDERAQTTLDPDHQSAESPPDGCTPNGALAPPQPVRPSGKAATAIKESRIEGRG